MTRTIAKTVVGSFAPLPNFMLNRSCLVGRKLGEFPFGKGFGRGGILQNLCLSESGRYFSTACIEAPSWIEKYDEEDGELLVQDVAVNLQETLQDSASRGCVKSQKFLDALSDYGRKKLSAIMFVDLPKQRVKEPTVIPDAIALIAGLKRHEQWPRPISVAGQENLDPHQDFKRTDVAKGGVKALVFVGVHEAPDGTKVETCYIEPQKILAELKTFSPSAFETLSRSIFFYADKKSGDVGNGRFAIIDAANGEINFPSDLKKISCDAGTSSEEMQSSWAALNSLIKKMIEREDYEKFEIKPGTMLLLDNAGLHFRQSSEEAQTNPKNISSSRMIYASFYSIVARDVEFQSKTFASKLAQDEKYRT